jgi:energy-coupling factor transporter ATP-binding protein EcfA2
MDAIRIERLCKTFSNGRKALDAIGLKVGEGEMVALIGALGSRKSTFARHIAGFTASDPRARMCRCFGDPCRRTAKWRAGLNGRSISSGCASVSNVAIKSVALQSSLAHPAVEGIIPGANRPERISEKIALMHAPIPAEL